MKNGEAYSLDLRERVMRARRDNDWTFKETANFFRIGEATVNRWARLEREQGHLARRQRGPGKPPLLSSEHLQELTTLLEEKADRTLPELATDLSRRIGKTVTRSTVGRAVLKLGFTLKKKSSTRRKSIVPTSKSGGRRFSKK